MEINIEAIKKLIKDKYRDNQSWFASDIGINISYLNEIINKRKSAKSNKLCLAIIKWCEKNKENHKKYIIFLNQFVQKNKQGEAGKKSSYIGKLKYKDNPIQKYRMEHNLTTKEFSSISQIPVPTIRTLEQGKQI